MKLKKSTLLILSAILGAGVGIPNSNNDCKKNIPIANTDASFIRFQRGSMAALLARGEAGGAGYNAYNTGKTAGNLPHRSIVSMRISEVIRLGRLKRGHKSRLYAVGMYQVIPSTLLESVAFLQLDTNLLMDAETQELLFAGYLASSKRKKLMRYIMGKSTDITGAGIDAAREWRGIADPRTGKTYGDRAAKHNKAGISSTVWAKAMRYARDEYATQMRAGQHHHAAYSAALHTGAPK